MCIVCALWNKGNLKTFEVDQALAELVEDGLTEEQLDHVQEVIEKAEKELKRGSKS